MKPILDFKSEEYTLKNGIRVVMVEHKDATSVGVLLRAQAGSIQEGANDIGVAHLLEHVMLTASKKFPDTRVFTQIIENTGGKYNAITGPLFLDAWAKILPDKLQEALIFLSQAWQHPLLDKQQVEKEKRVVIEEIARDKNNLRKIARRFGYEHMYPKHRLSIAPVKGDVKDIEHLDTGVVQKYFNQKIVPQNTTLVVFGRFNPDNTKNLIEKFFGENTGGNSELKLVHDPEPNPELVVHTEDRAESELIRLSIFYPIRDEKKIGSQNLAVFTEMLGGGGRKSKLFQAIREKYQMSYLASSYYSPMYAGGLLEIYTEISKENVNRALEIIACEIRSLSEKKIPELDLEIAKQRICSQLAFTFEDPVHAAKYYADIYTREIGIKNPKDAWDKTSAISTKNIKNTAESVFKSRPKIVALGANISGYVLEVPDAL